MKIRITVTTTITKTDLVNIASWTLLLAFTAAFWYGVTQLFNKVV